MVQPQEDNNFPFSGNYIELEMTKLRQYYNLEKE